MGTGFEKVTREQRRASFAKDATASLYNVGTRLVGFKSFALIDLFISYVLKQTQSALFSAPLAYNPSYFKLIETLKRKGFIKDVSVRAMYYDYPKVISYFISAHGKVHDLEHATVASSMVLPERGHDEALSKALGELLERDAAKYPGDRVLRTRRIQLPFSITDIPQFTQTQRAASNRYIAVGDEQELFTAVKVRNVITNRKVWLPQQYVFYGKGVRGNNEKYLLEATTNGCGGGFTFSQAAVSALCEFFERDHFLLWWFSGVAPRRIKIQDSTPLSVRITEAEHRYGLEVYFLDTSYDSGLSSVVCVIIDPVLSIVGMGGKAGVHWDSVLEGAYAEALTLLHSTRYRISSGQKADSFFKKNDFTDMNMYQMERETQCCTQPAIQYIKKTFLAGPEVNKNDLPPSPFATCEDDAEVYNAIIRYHKDHIDQSNPAKHIYVYEFESKWLSECDYHAVRAVIPSHLKLHLREGYATPCSNRLRDFCAVQKIPYVEGEVNTIPHFFP